MRVLLISWEYPPVIEGGLARHVRKLSEALIALGCEVHVLTRGSRHLPANELRHGVSVHRVSEPGFPDDIGAFVRWVGQMNADMQSAGAELIAQHDFALVHSHDWLVATAAEGSRGRAGCRGSRRFTPPSTAGTTDGFRSILNHTSMRSRRRWFAAPIR
jgi:glycogen(starch) synthase